MPYPTFFHLPDDKRQRIMDAVWQEFTTVSYTDASINRIIQNAGISRGSFYQYFTGKQDLFSYLLGTMYQASNEMFAAMLMAHNNDPFFAMLGLYDMLLWTKSKGRFNENQRKMRMLLKLNIELDLSQFTMPLDGEQINHGFRSLMQENGYWLQNEEESAALLHMLLAVGVSSLADTVRRPEHEARNRRMLEQQLLFIRKGLTPYTP